MKILLKQTALLVVLLRHQNEAQLFHPADVVLQPERPLGNQTAIVILANDTGRLCHFRITRSGQVRGAAERLS